MAFARLHRRTTVRTRGNVTEYRTLETWPTHTCRIVCTHRRLDSGQHVVSAYVEGALKSRNVWQSRDMALRSVKLWTGLPIAA